MNTPVLVLQILISIALIVAISIQVKGGGFGRSFGAQTFTRRGLEKLVFRATFVLVFLFIVSSIYQFLI